MARIRLTTILDAPIGEVWSLVMRPATLIAISGGLMSFRPVDPPSLPETWRPGQYRLAMRGFGVVPLGWQVIGIEILSPHGDVRRLRDNGHGALFPRWDHLITLEAIEAGRTRYTDDVDFDARALTPLATPLVRQFYAHRQRGWRRLIAEGRGGAT